MVEIIMLLTPYITALIAVIAAFVLGRATAPNFYEQGFSDGCEAQAAEEQQAISEHLADLHEEQERALALQWRNAFDAGAREGARHVITHPRLREL